MGEKGKVEDKEERKSDFLICTTPAAQPSSLLKQIYPQNITQHLILTSLCAVREVPQIHLN